VTSGTTAGQLIRAGLLLALSGALYAFAIPELQDRAIAAIVAAMVFLVLAPWVLGHSDGHHPEGRA
jgi:hypothetical protein